MTENKYAFFEVGGINCPQIETLSGDESNGQYCKINAMELCSGENCPHGKTIEEMAEEIAKDAEFCNDVGYGVKEAAISGVKALLGGGNK